MKFCFSTLSCPVWSWRQIIENGVDYGYDGVELRILEGETDLLSRSEFSLPERVRRSRELSDAGFRVCGLGSSVRFHDTNKSALLENLETGRAYLDLARDLDADFVRVFGDIVPEGFEEHVFAEQVATRLDELGEYAESLQLQVLLETHGDFSNSRLVKATFEQVSSSAVGILWDTHHPWRFCGETLQETFTRLRPWVKHTHWKDSVAVSRKSENDATLRAASEAHSLMGGHRHADYVLYGEGEFPALECMKLLRESAYDGWYCYEWEKAWHPEIESPEIALPPFPQQMRKLAELAVV